MSSRKKCYVGLVSFIFTSVLLSACAKNESGNADTEISEFESKGLETTEQKVSYVLGYSLATEIQKAGMDVDLEVVNVAIEDVRGKNELALSRKQMGVTGSLFQNLKREKETAKVRQENIEHGRIFLAKNLENEGVKATSSGLQYLVLIPGEGQSPSDTNQVSVHYKGLLLDGTEFDSSLESTEPVSFFPDQVIPGWSEALKLMRKGSKWKVWVPYNLAYPNGTQTIPSGSTLEFEIELVDFQ